MMENMEVMEDQPTTGPFLNPIHRTIIHTLIERQTLYFNLELVRAFKDVKDELAANNLSSFSVFIDNDLKPLSDVFQTKFKKISNVMLD